FDAAVLSAALRRVVGGDGLALAVAAWDQAACRDPLLGQVVHDRIRTPIRQPQVVFLGADSVGVSVDVHGHVRICVGCGRGVLQDRCIAGADVVLVEVEVHTTQYDLLLNRRWRRGRWRRWRRWWWWRWRLNDRITNEVTGDQSDNRTNAGTNQGPGD